METKKRTASKNAVKTATKKVVASRTSAKKAVAKKVAAKKTVAAKTKAKKVVKKITKPKTVAAFKKHKQETKVSHRKNSCGKFCFKRLVYKFVALTLGLLVAMAAYLFLELVYLKSVTQNFTPQAHNFLGAATYLPIWVSSLFLIGGLLLGSWLGAWGWKVVYIEHKHRMFKRA